MGQNDTNSSPFESDVHGILRCLKLLAEEAASLRLSRTLAALRAAMAVCESENQCESPDSASAEEEEAMTEAERPIVLH